MKEQGPVPKAVAGERQTARASIPRRIREGAEAARQSGVAPALVHSADEHPIGLACQLARRETERLAEFVAVVQAGVRGEQAAPLVPDDRPGVRNSALRRSGLNEQRALNANRGDRILRRCDRLFEAALDLAVDRFLVERNNAGERDHLWSRPAPGQACQLEERGVSVPPPWAPVLVSSTSVTKNFGACHGWRAVSFERPSAGMSIFGSCSIERPFVSRNQGVPRTRAPRHAARNPRCSLDGVYHRLEPGVTMGPGVVRRGERRPLRRLHARRSVAGANARTTRGRQVARCDALARQVAYNFFGN
jgi:hypothetical protein